LYLDREGDMLLARLEYVYDDITINPLAEQNGSTDPNRILMRDSEQEYRFMNYLESSGFRRDGIRLWLEEEDAVYTFLYHTLPELEKLMDVYATSSFKPILEANSSSPKISIDWDEKTRWLEVKFDLNGIAEQDILQVLRTLVEKKPYVRLPDGSFLSLEHESFQELGMIMQHMDIRKSDIKGDRMKLSVARGFQLLAGNETFRSLKLGKAFRQLLDNVNNPDSLEFPVPAELNGIMRGYQKYGFQWLKTLAHYRFGGILADDMGLGKTLQAIAYIVSEKEQIRSDGSPVLIVCPASLTYNWLNEITRFAPSLRAEVVAGARQERTELIQSLSNKDVIITSYPLLRRDMDLYEPIQFHTLILDEAQAIKNHTTLTAQTVREIQATQRFALTGTPVENSLEELWSIFDAVFPELFVGRKAFNDLTRDNVARRVRPFILRRMKRDVLKELPDKIETLQTSELSVEQKKLYMAYLAKLQEETVAHLSQDGFQKNRIKILAGITRLRQLCCHPALFIEDYAGDSGKLEQLMEIVEEALGSGKRILLFSQFTGMLAIIRSELERRGETCFYLDGQTPAAKRVELCQRFNDGEQDLFLISLKAGGTGLNLAGADTVILYDLWWNPAVEQQATDRAHRIGQTNVVQVIRLISQGTVEEKMYELQQKKKDLVDQVIQPGEEALSSMSEEDLREILMI
jgi:SNF2 family DNA or RNA helicase